MTLLISHIRSWNLDTVDQHATTLQRGHDALADSIDRAYRTMDTATSNWTGAAATAAWDSASRQHTFGRNAVTTISDAQRCIATQATHLRYARESLLERADAATADGFTVSDNGGVTATPARIAGTDPQELEDLLEYHYWRVTSALGDINDIDARATRELTDITNTGTSLIDHKADYGIPDLPLGTLTEEPGASPVQFDGHGARDSDVLAQPWSSTPESGAAQQRLIAATTLTPEQQAQLAAGQPVTLDPKQLAYLRDFYGDTNLDELTKIGTQAQGVRSVYFPDAGVPADSRISNALASGMFTVTNPNITDGNGNVGGLDNLPPDVREIFTDPATTSHIQPGGSSTTVNINHFDDAKTLTKILQNADPATQTGSALSSALLDRTADLAPLHVQTSPSAPMQLIFDDDGQPITDNDLDTSLTNTLDVATRDIPANSDFITDPAHSGDLTNLLTREWNDDGRAVSGLTDWIGPDATNPDPAIAERAGTTALALAHNLADNKDTYLDIPGLDNKSVGEINPALTQSIGAAMTPYIGNLVNLSPEETGTLGFDNFDGPANGYQDVKALFTIINSDPDASATFNAHVLGAIGQLQGGYVDSSPGMGADTSLAMASGRLQELMEKGLSDEAFNRTGDAVTAHEATVAQKGQIYDKLGWLVTGSAAMIPGFGPPTSIALSMLGVELRPDAVGGAPVPVATPHFNTYHETSVTAMDYNLVRAYDAAYGSTDYPELTKYRVNGDSNLPLPDRDLSNDGRNYALDNALQKYLQSRGFERDQFMINVTSGREVVR